MPRYVSLALALLVGLFITTAFADRALPDLARPKEAKVESEPAKLIVRRAPRSAVNRIVIPRQYIATAKAGAPFGSAAPGEGAAAPAPSRNIIAGVALSLAIVAAFFAFRNRKPALAAATAVGAVLIGAFGIWVASVSADIPAPSERGPKIVIEIVEEGDAVVLTLGRGL